ncbi:RNA polymerase sigma factor [bacterium]|nr:RNA polymerase sigma factor [bacterium]MDY4582894.1 RNA polymerase sigma factor [Candidatus Faecousia sp.]
MSASLRSNEEIMEIYDRHVDTVYRVCFAYMKNAPEAEDMTQETFLRLMSWGKPFENQRHEKAWLIVTASNLCKDTLKKWWRSNENIDDYAELLPDAPQTGHPVLDAILELPQDYKVAVYMYYYEGYTTVEIARYLKCPESTVRSRLSRARKQLQTILGGVKV